MKKLNVAIVGIGKIGSEYDSGLNDIYVYSHTKAYLLNSNVQLIAVCDSNIKQKESYLSKWGLDIPFYETLSALLETHDNIDLISICTPTNNHLDSLLEICKTKIPFILCEKPITENYEDIEKLERIFKNHKHIFINHVLRWEPGVLKIKEILQSQNFNIQSVNAVYAKGLKHNGTHIIDLSLFLFGEPISIIKTKEFEEIHGDPTCDFVFQYKDFCIYFFGMKEKNYSIFEYRIYTDNCKIEIGDLTNKIGIYNVQNHPYLKNYKLLSPEFFDLNCQQFRNMSCVINDIVDGIISGNTELFRCNLENVKLTMKYLKKIGEIKCHNSQ